MARRPPLGLALGLAWALRGALGGPIVAEDERLDGWGEGGGGAAPAASARPRREAAPSLEQAVERDAELLGARATPPQRLMAAGKLGNESLEGSGWVVGKQAACEGKEVRYTPCRRAPCSHSGCTPQNCLVGAWSDWSDGDCTGLCLRQRGVARPNNHCGLPCNVSLIQTKRCATSCNPEVTCPKGTDCQWDAWTDWSACTCSCGGGQKTRDRQIKVAPEGSGKKCPAEVKSQMVPCNTRPCGMESCTDGSWDDWGAWGSCSAACGGGLQWRVRKVLTEASECGKPVEGNDRELRYCNPQGCSGDRDCLFGDWTVWGPCSCSCDGVKHRSRRIEVYGKGDGEWCNGGTKEVAPCNDGPLLEGEGGRCTREEAAVDCEFSTWSDWSKCSTSCGYGQHVRERHVYLEAKNFGAACKGALKEAARCKMGSCNDSLSHSAKPCIWGVWQDWGSCDKCGGQRKRFRLILQMPEDGGEPCHPEASEETGQCPRQCDSVYCTWGDWVVGECSVSCGAGTVRRERSLSASAKPPPDVNLYGILDKPAVVSGSSPWGNEGAFIGVVGGCLLTLLAQWSWQRADARHWPRQVKRTLRGSGHGGSEEEMPLFQMQAHGHGQWMPVDTAGSDGD